MTLHRTLPAALLAFVAGTAPARVAAGDGPSGPLAEYREAMSKYSSLGMRTSARDTYATTRSRQALDVLLGSYADPERGEPAVRYLLAEICGEAFLGTEHGPAFSKWTARYRAPADAWLWYHGARVATVDPGPTAALAPALEARDPFLLAATIEALALADSREGYETAFGRLDALPADAFDRGLVLGALASVSLALKPRLAPGKDANGLVPLVAPRLVRLAKAVDDPATPASARLVVARHLSALLGLPKPVLRGAILAQAIEALDAPPPSGDGDRYARPTFMGVEAVGRRIAYVIDLSDSMLTPLSADEIRDLRRPVTPSDPAPGMAPPPADPALDLPWDRIRTRFDAAREFLRLSLEALGKDQSFVVAWFGTTSGLLEATPGFRPASRVAVAAVTKELDAIRPGKATIARPHGTLRGDTNVHGGLRHAFAAVPRGLVKAAEYVSREAQADGCDTVFLLSDGLPTADDFPGSDSILAGRGTYDPETGSGSTSNEPPSVRNVAIRGPYSYAGRWLEGDVRRLNLFRKAEIHCVGIGEADRGLLGRLAAIGLGKVRIVGSPTALPSPGR